MSAELSHPSTALQDEVQNEGGLQGEEEEEEAVMEGNREREKK